MAGSVKFGTSGLRGLASELSGMVARRHVGGFLAYLEASGGGGTGRVYLGRDLRASSRALLEDCARSIRVAGLEPVDCGVLPTPALALHAMALGAPAIMVTGSHIPADRNGLKFYRPEGEITKADEAAILGALGTDPGPGAAPMSEESALAGDRYRQRYRFLVPNTRLAGWRIGVFEHSGVARDLLVSLFTRAGADVVRLGRTEDFVPVDTEAVGDPVFAPVPGWLRAHRLDAIVSTDGDGDRPLLIAGDGRFVRGDALGLLAARFVGATRVVTPVTSNSAIEATGWFSNVTRTRVGSPFVLSGMAAAGPDEIVVGFEANGGTLLGSDVVVNGKVLVALPTRDALLPLLAALSMAAERGVTLSALVDGLQLKAAASDRLADVPQPRSEAFLSSLVHDRKSIAERFVRLGPLESLSTVDGPRLLFRSGEVVHYRGSGNAPELRCYVEAANDARAAELLAFGLDLARRAVSA